MAEKWTEESDIRGALRKQVGEGVLQVSPGIGGTEGIPDTFLLGLNIWIELKVAEWSERKSKFLLKYRPKQLIIIDRMRRLGTPMITVFGEAGETALWWCPYDETDTAYPLDVADLPHALKKAAAEVERRLWGE